MPRGAYIDHTRESPPQTRQCGDLALYSARGYGNYETVDAFCKTCGTQLWRPTRVKINRSTSTDVVQPTRTQSCANRCSLWPFAQALFECGSRRYLSGRRHKLREGPTHTPCVLDTVLPSSSRDVKTYRYFFEVLHTYLEVKDNPPGTFLGLGDIA